MGAALQRSRTFLTAVLGAELNVHAGGPWLFNHLRLHEFREHACVARTQCESTLQHCHCVVVVQQIHSSFRGGNERSDVSWRTGNQSLYSSREPQTLDERLRALFYPWVSRLHLAPCHRANEALVGHEGMNHGVALRLSSSSRLLAHALLKVS